MCSLAITTARLGAGPNVVRTTVAMVPYHLVNTVHLVEGYLQPEWGVVS